MASGGEGMVQMWRVTLALNGNLVAVGGGVGGCDVDGEMNHHALGLFYVSFAAI